MIPRPRFLATLGVSGLGAMAVPAGAQTTEKTARFDQLAALFQPATIVGVPDIAACTLSGGTKARCFRITTVAAPSDHVTGPFCPRTELRAIDETHRVLGTLLVHHPFDRDAGIDDDARHRSPLPSR